MGRASTKENKNEYFQAREALGLTRAEASELLETITEDKLERIESGKIAPRAEDVLIMAQKYKKPELCNYYCSNECPIGQKMVPQVKIKELQSIVLEMLAALNNVGKTKDRLIEIAADGVISADEIDDFIAIQNELERISTTVDTLKLWTEKMLSSGAIDRAEYEKKIKG